MTPDEMKDRIAELDRKLYLAAEAIAKLEDKAQANHEQLARQQSALAHYGRHDPRCTELDEYRCGCGLNQAAQGGDWEARWETFLRYHNPDIMPEDV
jgi:hypothetical protein